MGRWTLAALVVNAVIGSGIFGLPATVARLVGPAAPWAWIVGALGNGLVMLCFAEVASRFAAAGGAYLYARESLPRLLAILVGWLALLTRVTAASAGANLFTVHLAEFLPAAEGESARIALLVLLIGGLALVNYRGVESGARWNNLFTVAKLLPLGLFVAAGGLFALTHAAPGVAAVAGAAGRPPASAGDWLQASLLICFAYGGYDGAMMAMGEARNPRRDAPFALLSAMVFLALLYTAVQLVVDATLADPASSPRVLVEAARTIFGPWGGALLAAGAVISIAGFLGANFLNAPRLGFALTEHRDLPALFGRIHPAFRTPYVAILSFAFLVLVLAVYGSFEWSATLSAVSRLFVYGSTCIALLVLRRRRPGESRFTLPGGALFPLLGIAFCLLLMSRMGRMDALLLAAVAALATAHWAMVRRAA
ncbi:MAG: Amino acid permease [Acidobacteriota bacterium]|nr:Amino acid permease [Acidobacteriota bacterium]